MRRLLLATSLLAGACFIPPIDDLGEKACDEQGRCLEGFHCHQGRCVPGPAPVEVDAGADAGIDAGGTDSGFDAGPFDAGRTIRSIRRSIHFADDGGRSYPVHVPAIVRFPVDGGWMNVPRVLIDAGIYEYRNAPPGPFWLTEAQHIWTDSDVIELIEYYPGRQGALPFIDGGKVSFDAGSLDPYNGYDLFLLTSTNTGMVVDLTALATPTPGATRYAATVELKGFFARQIDPAAGDRFALMHFATVRPNMPDGYRRLARQLTSSTIAIPDGVTTSFGGETAAIPLTGATNTVNFRRSAWSAHRPAAADAGIVWTQLQVVAAPPGFEVGFGRRLFPVMQAMPLDTLLVDRVISAQYTNPYGFPEVVQSDFFWQAAVALDAGRPAEIPLRVVRHQPTFEFNDIGPGVGPPRDLRVNGALTLAGVSDAGLTPSLSWTAPSLADGYSVEVLALWEQDVGGLATFYVPVATLRSTTTSITLPPGLLVPDRRYVFRVTAHRAAPGVNLNRFPFAQGVPSSLAQELTGIVAP